MGRGKDDIVWRKRFSCVLKSVFSIYNFTYENFADAYGWSSSTVRYWSIGRNLPNRDGLMNLKEYLAASITDDENRNWQLYKEIEALFDDRDEALEVYLSLRNTYPSMNYFVGEILCVCYNFAKHNSFIAPLVTHKNASMGTTQIVVFDFDGTLTSGNINETTWETLWTGLGYDIGLCKQLHQQYDMKKISHAEWCKITEDKFCERKLSKNAVYEIASNISLMQGVKETFCELAKRNIKIFIVSGSIKTIICLVLDDLCKYVEQINANEFWFDSAGYLMKIIGTKYDFEGKATFINEIAAKYQISEADILFVGNSINDRFAHMSGARTLCINPKLTDPTNRTVWNDCVPFCKDLTEILRFV